LASPNTYQPHTINRWSKPTQQTAVSSTDKPKNVSTDIFKVYLGSGLAKVPKCVQETPLEIVRQYFYNTGALPDAQPTTSKRLKAKS